MSKISPCQNKPPFHNPCCLKNNMGDYILVQKAKSFLNKLKIGKKIPADFLLMDKITKEQF
jgi:hypothetical protein